MLASNQVRASVRQGVLRPRWIDPASPELLERAAQSIALVEAALSGGWSRGRTEEELASLAQDSRDRKLADGLAKLLLDRCSFSPEEGLEPAALRDDVFRRARRVGPLSLEPGPLGLPTASDVLAEVALERGVSVDVVAASLFADLRDAHRILAFRTTTAEDLLHRYNVALVQALLLDAVELKIQIADPTPARIRQVLRWARFHQLIHSAVRTGDVLEIALDGPASLFSQSTRYGLALASFFPAVVLQDAAWTLTATILWTRARLRRRLEVGSADGLRAHLRDDGGHRTRESLWFEERFRAAESGWDLSPGAAPIDLGGRAVVVPDFTLRRGGRCAHLEIVGYWRSDWLARRLDLLRRYGPGNVVLAVSRKLCAEERPTDGWGPEVIEFSQVVPSKRVLEVAEAIAVPG
jgi:predicted nuclease of restriction endonuclease-like RecB superfamily